MHHALGLSRDLKPSSGGSEQTLTCPVGDKPAGSHFRDAAFHGVSDFRMFASSPRRYRAVPVFVFRAVLHFPGPAPSCSSSSGLRGGSRREQPAGQIKENWEKNLDFPPAPNRAGAVLRYRATAGRTVRAKISHEPHEAGVKRKSQNRLCGFGSSYPVPSWVFRGLAVRFCLVPAPARPQFTRPLRGGDTSPASPWEAACS